MSKLKRKHQDSGSSMTEHSASATEGCGFESRPECQPERLDETNSFVDLEAPFRTDAEFKPLVKVEAPKPLPDLIDEHKGEVGQGEIIEAHDSDVTVYPKSTVPQPLAKIEVNDDTGRCPFCRSVRVEQLPAMLQGFNRWSCLDCRKTFRAPISETQRRRSA